MRYLLDEMLSGVIADRLKDRGVDALAVEARRELRGRPDPDVLALALSERRSVVTYDTGFVALYLEYCEQRLALHGLVMLSTRRFPQRHRRTTGRLVKSLATLANDHPRGLSSIHWLR